MNATSNTDTIVGTRAWPRWAVAFGRVAGREIRYRLRSGRLLAAGTSSLLASVAIAGTTAAASTTEPEPAAVQTVPPDESSAGASGDTIDGLFDVGGGRNLYLHCEGSGAPTVVYLHGHGGSSSNAGEIPSLLHHDYRVCVYDRANVGRSDPAEGPRTVADAVEDLHTLLDAAEVPGPYVLLGASLGGLLEFVYASTHPDDVVGLVLLDPDVPGSNDWIIEFLDPELLLSEDELRQLWRDDPEKMDETASRYELDAAAESFPAVPAILLTPEEFELPPEFGEGAAVAYRQLQQEAMDLFDPGEVRVVESAHYMEPVIPEEIAAAVREVIGASSVEASVTSARHLHLNGREGP
jgi:pimeloyl-ACP methyl ester carboxylesterase